MAAGIRRRADGASAGRRRFVERLDRRALEEGAARAGVPLVEAGADARCSHLRRGWYWGRQAFAERVLALGQSAVRRQKGRAYRSTGARRSSEEAQAAQWLKEGLAPVELDATQLAQLRGSDPRKVAHAS